MFFCVENAFIKQKNKEKLSQKSTKPADLWYTMDAETIAYVASVFKALEYTDGVVFISFYWENLTEIRKNLPACPVQFLTNENWGQFLTFFRTISTKHGYCHEKMTNKPLTNNLFSCIMYLCIYAQGWETNRFSPS